MPEYLKRFLLSLMCITCLGIQACTGGGQVVQVRTATPEDFQTIGYEGMQDINEFQEEPEERRNQPEIAEFLQNREMLSVQQYVDKYPQPREIGFEYQVGPGDTLRISVQEDPQFNQTYKVMSDGCIFLPLLERLSVRGMTRMEIERLIKNKLADHQFILDPHVNVLLQTYQSKRVLAVGAVEKTGYYHIKPGDRILDFIFKSGGSDFIKNRNQIILIRELPNSQKKVAIKIDLAKLIEQDSAPSNLLLVDGDTIYFPHEKKFQVFVMGEVKKPGKIQLPEEDATLVEVIGQAGGFTRIAAKHKVRVIRRGQKEDTIFQVNVDAIISKGLKEKDLLLESGDIVVVPESFF